MSASAISVSRLAKDFSGNGAGRARNNPLRALDGVDLEVAPGEILGLLGANGAGKTTLVEILATHLLPTSGAARICGRDVVQQSREVRFLVGHAPAANDTFFPRLTVVQNLEFFAALYELPASAASERVAELIALVGLTDARQRSFQALSLGMQQRLALARALLADPPVLLLDEPTRSLDPSMQRQMHTLLREKLRHEQRKAVLLVTHSFQEAAEVCDRIAVLSRGRLTGCGTAAELCAATKTDNLAEAYERLAGHAIELEEDRSALLDGGGA